MQKTSTEINVIAANLTIPQMISVTGNVTGLTTSIKKMDNVSYQVNVTGSLVGTVTVQTSNDYIANSDGTANFAGNWVTIPSFSGSVNGAGSGVLELVTMPSQYIRPVFTYTSGAGTMNIIIDAKSGL